MDWQVTIIYTPAMTDNVTVLSNTNTRMLKAMRRLSWLFAIFLLVGCASVLKVRDIPDVRLDQAAFSPLLKLTPTRPFSPAITSKFY